MARRLLTFPSRLSLDSQIETGSEFDGEPQTPAKPHFNPFTDFFNRIPISAPSSSSFLNAPHRFTTTALQTYHSTTTCVPTFRALTARITRRKRTAVIFIATIGALILLAIMTEATPSTFKFRKTRTWDPLDAVFASGTTFGPSHERRNPHDLVLTPGQELGVLVSFMAAVKANTLPSDINPSKPLDPQLVVGFDTRAEGAEEEVDAVVEETWSNYPVVMFSQLYSPIGRDLRTLIATYNLAPKPVMWELDARDDADVIIPLVQRLTNSTELPVLLIGGQTVGSPFLIGKADSPTIIDQTVSARSVFERVKGLHGSGELDKLIQTAGGIIGGAKKKKGRYF